MIVDKIENKGKYACMHRLFDKAFEFLSGADSLPVGRYEVDGSDLYVIISDNVLRSQGEMEAHKEYIDIQLVLDGKENFLCAPVSSCHQVSKEYDASSDIMFFADEAKMSYVAEKGTFSIFFPEDAHQPLMGEGKVRKAIAKVRV